MLAHKTNLALIGWLVAAFAVAACSKDKGGTDTDAGVTDSGVTNGRDASTNGGDLGPDQGEPPDTGPRVQIDLAPYLPAPSGAQVARIFQLQDDNAPFSGPVVSARVGDWVIENDVIRVAIEADKRAMSPCPWGGTPIDAAYLAGGTDEDILGEVCSLMNGGLSFRPDEFEVLHDGTDGGAAVLATSGTLVVNDFLNLPTMIGDFVPSLGDRIGLDVNALLPLRVTQYYILAPGANSVLWLMALRNDAPTEQVHMLPLFLVASGGDGYYYNPMSAARGFGSAGAAGIALDSLPFLAFNGERASYAFAPEPHPSLDGGALPVAGSYMVVSNVAAAALGVSGGQILSLLTSSEEELAVDERMLHFAPHQVHQLEMRLFVGDGSLATMVDGIYEANGVATGVVEGTVRNAAGDAVAGARVTALQNGFRSFNQAVSGADGKFKMNIPSADYELVARHGAWTPAAPVAVTVTDGGQHEVGDVNLVAPGTLTVNVTTPDDGCDTTTGPQPVPARLTVVCVDECVKAPQTEADSAFHNLPSNVQAIVFGGASGELTVDLPAGEYDIVVSRGLEWSVWPPTLDAMHRITVVGGETLTIDAEIARVLDTGDAYGGDFHIHSVPSADSPVGYADRVLNYAAEGVDVIVATDHDHISDHRPFVTTLALDPWIQAVVGEEITTSDFGHFNAFPLVQDLTDSRGGAVDWGNGDSYTHDPAELYAALAAFPGEQVIQVNHADGLGLIKLVKADVLRGITYADREKHRLAPQTQPGKTPEDTGIWSDDFTAMELLNGNSVPRFYRLGRWWMQMIGRGFAPTGTAVTDTHKLYSHLGGVPRSYVWGNDTAVACGDKRFGNLTDYDGFLENFVENVNAGAVIGTNGPFANVWVDGEGLDPVGLGGTLRTDGAPFVAHLHIQAPEWARPETIDVYLNPPFESVETGPGELIETPIPTQQTLSIAWDEATHLSTVKTGAQEHKVWQQTIEIPLQTADDAFLIFVVRDGESMAPVTEATPFMFTNPVFIDVDGNGYDNPPYAAQAAMPPTVPPLPPRITKRVTPEELIHAIRAVDCTHPGHDH